MISVAPWLGTTIHHSGLQQLFTGNRARAAGGAPFGGAVSATVPSKGARRPSAGSHPRWIRCLRQALSPPTPRFDLDVRGDPVVLRHQVVDPAIRDRPSASHP